MRADVCFILEGTYPYVAGGVSTWVDQLIKANPHLRFAILHLAANDQSSQVLKYELPHNVISLKTAYLHDTKLKSAGKPYKDKRIWRRVRQFYKHLPNVDIKDFALMVNSIYYPGKGVNTKSLLFSKETWNLLIELYGDRDISFIDYFWTWRFTHLPLLSLLNVEIPAANVYHSASTGYAGLVACIAKIRHGGSYLLSEHGIYSKERKIEISQSNWVYDERSEQYAATANMGFFRQFWIQMFMIMSKLSYMAADHVTTLYSGNLDMQVEHGCALEKLQIIPNGIDVDGYKEVIKAKKKIKQNETNRKFTIGFVGRVTPIKDVKTFLRAVKVIAQKHPIHVLIMGPVDEDPEYVEECKILVDMFEIGEVIEFTGRVNVREYYPKLDVVVLTSVSEGLPFVVLEANAAGIPSVCSDVGACKELVYGQTAEDIALGPSGVLTKVASADETAEGVIGMIEDRKYYEKLCETALMRVDLFYRIENINAEFTQLYHKLMYN